MRSIIRFDACLPMVYNYVYTYHAAHGVDSTPVAGPDEAVGVALHEVLSHADEYSVGQEAVRVRLEGLDVAEDVIPSAAVEADRVVSELVKDLVHLEDSRKSFDQNRRPDAPSLNPRHLLCSTEYGVPYFCFPACIWEWDLMSIVKDRPNPQ